MAEQWRVQQRAGMYADLIWDDEGERQHLIAEVHIDGIAERIVADRAIALAARAYREAWHAENALTYSDMIARRAALFAVLDAGEGGR